MITQKEQARQYKNKGGIIGGMFGLDLHTTEYTPFAPVQRSQCFYLANASSAIWMSLQICKPKRIWLPAYLCPSIVRSINAASVDAHFYGFEKVLLKADRQWLDRLEKTDCVLFIDYFGFRFDRNLVDLVKDRGAFTIRDASHSLLGDTQTDFDFTIFSPRKFTGIPDGALLYVNPRLPQQTIGLRSAPKDWELLTLKASILRHLFDSQGRTNEWYAYYCQAVEIHPIGPYEMSAISKYLLTHCLDIRAIKKTRRRNYSELAHKLSRLAVFPDLPDDIIPLGFPVYMSNRDHVRQHLIAHKIYPPIHWNIDQAIPKIYDSSHNLAKHILTLPCDQRYTTDDMRRIVACLEAEESS